MAFLRTIFAWVSSAALVGLFFCAACSSATRASAGGTGGSDGAKSICPAPNDAPWETVASGASCAGYEIGLTCPGDSSADYYCTCSEDGVVPTWNCCGGGGTGIGGGATCG